MLNFVVQQLFGLPKIAISTLVELQFSLRSVLLHNHQVWRMSAVRNIGGGSMQKAIKFYESGPSPMRHRVAWDLACLHGRCRALLCHYVLLLPRLESLPATPAGVFTVERVPSQVLNMRGASNDQGVIRRSNMRVAVTPYSRPNLTEMEIPEP